MGIFCICNQDLHCFGMVLILDQVTYSTSWVCLINIVFVFHSFLKVCVTCGCKYIVDDLYIFLLIAAKNMSLVELLEFVEVFQDL